MGVKKLAGLMKWFLLVGGIFLGISLIRYLILGPRSVSGSAIPNALAHFLVPDKEKFYLYQPDYQAQPLEDTKIPQHPYMANNVGNNMHSDAYMSDTHAAVGPAGYNLEILSRTQGFGGYGTIAFDRSRRLIAVYSNGRGFQLEMMDANTLEELASYDLPARSPFFLLEGILPWEYIGAGMYFYLDEQDRAIVPTTRNTIQVIRASQTGETASFTLEREYDLSNHVVSMTWPAQDSVAWVLPDWEGAHYWYATTQGMIGTVAMDTGQVNTMRLQGEIIENSFAVGQEGVFIISDYALYRLDHDGNGNIQVDWRLPYDRGPAKKPGHITRGSGTSVTLLGSLDGFVSVTDNAEPQINLLFVRREDGSEVCRMPLFSEGKSGTDITTIGFEHTPDSGLYSVIVENNWGRHFFPLAFPEPGITRIDLVRQPDGSYQCEQVWTSVERNLGVFKMSLGNGLIYLYFREGQFPFSRWYFTTLDFQTGNTVYKQLAGTGIGYNNWAGAIFIHPKGEKVYSTSIFGLVMMRNALP